MPTQADVKNLIVEVRRQSTPATKVVLNLGPHGSRPDVGPSVKIPNEDASRHVDAVVDSITEQEWHADVVATAADAAYDTFVA